MKKGRKRDMGPMLKVLNAFVSRKVGRKKTDVRFMLKVLCAIVQRKVGSREANG